MHNKQSSKSLQVRIQVAATWKYKTDDNVTKTLVFSLLMLIIYILKQSSLFLLPHKSKPEEKKAALYEYLSQRKVWIIVNVHKQGAV